MYVTYKKSLIQCLTYELFQLFWPGSVYPPFSYTIFRESCIFYAESETGKHFKTNYEKKSICVGWGQNVGPESLQVLVFEIIVTVTVFK